MAGVIHVGGYCTARDLSSMTATPRNTPRADVGTEPDEALAGEVIEIELEALLKAGSGSGRGIAYSHNSVGAILLQTCYQTV